MMPESSRLKSTVAERLWCRTFGLAGLYRRRAEDSPLLGPGKPIALLAYLALAPRQRALREHVVELFWRDVSPPEARHALRQTLYRLRRAAGVPLVSNLDQHLQLEETIEFDCLTGERLISNASSEGDLATATSLLRGNFLEGFAAPESPELEEWLEAQRTRFRTSWFSAADALGRRYELVGNADALLSLAEETAGLRPFDDEPVRQVMVALAMKGLHATALGRFHGYAELLRAELEDDPAEELSAFAAEIEQFLKHRRPAPASVLPFVGREQPWATLEAAWLATRQGGGSAILIEGAAGTGKTRLLSELHQRVASSPATILATKCYEIEQNIPFGALADAIAPAASHPRVAELDPAWRSEAARLLPEVRERFPDLPPADATDGSRAGQRRLHGALARIIDAVSSEGPVLIEIDDVQWADSASLEALHIFSRKLRNRSALLVATYRPAELAPVARQFARSLCTSGLAQLVMLDPLSPVDVEKLLRKLGDFRDDMPADLFAAQLHRHSGGNPLFLAELLQSLEQSRLLHVVDGVWRGGSATHAEGLPNTLAKLLADRIDRLSPFPRTCVETLAVAADEVAVELLAAALQISEPRAELGLHMLEEARLAHRAGAGTFELAHDELRRLVYQSTPDERKRLLHSAVGAALERLGEAQRPGGGARLAYHFDQAGDHQRAHRYAMAAVAEAGRLSPGEAEQHHLAVAGAHAPLALPPGTPPGKVTPVWPRAFARRRTRVALAVAALIMAAGGFASGLMLAGPGRGTPDFAQGRLYLRPDTSLTPTLRVQWPGVLRRSASLRLLRQPPSDFGMPVFHAWVEWNGVTHAQLFRVSGNDTIRITTFDGDDYVTHASPDRRAVLVQRGWRTANRTYQSNIIVLDTMGRIVRGITETPYQDGSATWSPTGTRIAFTRNELGKHSIWILDADGANPRNLTSTLGLPPHQTRPTFSGSGDALVLAYHDTGEGRGAVLVVDLRAETARSLPLPSDLRPRHAAFSPDGAWVAVVAQKADSAAVWMFDANGTRAATRLVDVSDARVVLEWSDTEPRYVERVELFEDTLTVRTGSGVRLGAQIHAVDGSQVEESIRWSVEDTSIAGVDSLGFVRGRAIGRTRVRASAGGFRADSATITVVGAVVDTLFVEDWSGGIDTARWSKLGHPRPRTVRDSGVASGELFFNQGDYNHMSGAISQARFSPDENGFTVQVSGWMGFTGGYWQSWIFGLVASPSRTIASGEMYAPFTDAEISVGGQSPVAAMPLFAACVAQSGRSQRSITPSQIAGQWLAFAIQVRPDTVAECYMEGALIAAGRIPRAVWEEGAFSVVLAGRSVDTRIYHGKVIVTTGLRY